MKTAHLFSGAGGGLLADIILGHEPVLAVEHDKNCCTVLRNHADDGWFPGLHVHEGDVRLFDPSEWAGRVDAIHAGFPCQDISAAGKGQGITGARSGLVSEVFRAIDAIRPRFVFLENSPRIRTRGRDVVIGALVARGYAWRDGIIGAADVGAWHQRDRWFCLAANADGLRELQQEGSESDIGGWVDNFVEARITPDHERIGHELSKTAEGLLHHQNGEREARREGRDSQPNSIIAGAANAPDAMRQGCQDGSGITTTETESDIRRPVDVELGQGIETGGTPWFEVECAVERLVYGVAADLVPGAVKALGNGQVPLQAAVAYLLLGGTIA